jgi:hypothetical protein
MGSSRKERSMLAKVGTSTSVATTPTTSGGNKK